MNFPFLPRGSSRFLVATNTASQFLGRVVSSGAIFVASILIARAFGANGYGDFIKITSYIALFYLLADFGMNAIYLQRAEGRENLWPTLFWLRVIGSILLVFLALAVLTFLPQGIRQGYTSGVKLGIILFSPAIILQAIITTTNAVFQQKLRYDLSTAAVTAGAIVTVFLIWAVALSTSPLVGPIASTLAFLCGTLATALIGLIFVRRFVIFRFAFDREIARRLVVASFPLGLTLLFNQIYFRADSIILTLTRSTADVGIYGFAYKIFEVALVLPTFFMNSVYPLMLKNAGQSNGQQLRRMVKKSLVVLGVGALIVTALLWSVAPLLVLVRPEFSESIGVLRILSLSLPLFFVTSLLMWTIVTMNRQGILIPIYGFSMVGNILANSFLIPSYGYVAAAWVTVGSEAVVLLLTGSVVLRRFR
ncbi:oligosaccharide flippase family protein [Candidatus Gottesmanbacteria bacterium]|nr:oligosaccharide flippase family protein [Candidatus Gottesmanbacteria bacterium]